MKLFNHKIKFGLGIWLTISLAACGGGTSSGTTDSTDDGTVVTTESLESLSNIPDLDIDSLDIAGDTSSANLSSLVRSALKNVEEDASTDSQEYSREGCEVRAQVDEFKQQIKQFQQQMCIMKTVEAESAIQVTVGQYNYYQLNMEGDFGPDEESQSQNVRLRLGLVDDALTLRICDQNEDESYSLSNSITFTVTDGAFNGTIVDNFTDAATGSTFASRITALIKSDDPSDFAVGDTASLSGQFNGDWGAGSVSLDIEKTDDGVTNTIDASFQSGGDDNPWGSWTSLVYGIYDADGGCSQFNSTGEFPAQPAEVVFAGVSAEEQSTISAELGESMFFCWAEPADPTAEGLTIADFIEPAGEDGMCDFTNENTACFLYSAAEDGSLNFFVDDTGTSAYLDTVSSHDLGTFSAPSISFTADEDWDCEADAGGFTAVTLDSTVIAAVMENCMEDFSSRSMESCYDQEKDEQMQDEFEIEVEDPSEDDLADTDSQPSEGDDDGTCVENEAPDGACQAVVSEQAPQLSELTSCNTSSALCEVACSSLESEFAVSQCVSGMQEAGFTCTDNVCTFEL